MVQVGEVRYNRTGPTGNIFSIMGGASKILSTVGRKSAAEDMVNRVTKSGSYEEALAIIGEYVRLVEDDSLI